MNTKLLYSKRNILMSKCVFNTIFVSNPLIMALKLIYIYIYIATPTALSHNSLFKILNKI